MHSISPISFGKIFVTPEIEQKETLYKHTAYGIGEGSVKDFKEKYRLTNLSKRYDIELDANGADVLDKKTNRKISFESKDYSDYPNVLYHILNAAMNYVLVKESRTFETEDTKL